MSLRIPDHNTASLAQRAAGPPQGAGSASKPGGAAKAPAGPSGSGAALGINTQQAQSLSDSATLRGAQAGLNAVRTASAALDKTLGIVAGMGESLTGAQGLDETRRAGLAKQLDDRRAEIDQVAKGTTFNGQRLLDGSLAGSGMEVEAGGRAFGITFPSGTVDALGLSGLSVADDESLASASEAVGRAHASLLAARSGLAATETDLGAAALGGAAPADADEARAVTEATRATLGQQAEAAALAQGNVAPQAVLALLR